MVACSAPPSPLPLLPRHVCDAVDDVVGGLRHYCDDDDDALARLLDDDGGGDARLGRLARQLEVQWSLGYLRGVADLYRTTPLELARRAGALG